MQNKLYDPSLMSFLREITYFSNIG